LKSTATPFSSIARSMRSARERASSPSASSSRA
jgi:hypothetical protein